MSRAKSKSRTRSPKKPRQRQLAGKPAVARRTGEELRSHLEEVGQNYQALKRQFILTELELSSTFFEVANSTMNEERAIRNLKNARQAYISAARFLSTAELTPAETREISEKMDLLREQLQHLGPIEPGNEAHPTSAGHEAGE